MFFTLEQEHLSSNCPYCKSAETFVSLYKESRYCKNCDRTYNQSDEIRLLPEWRLLAKKKEDAKLHIG